jgi:hypothetical protein
LPIETAGFVAHEDLLKDVSLFRPRLSELLPAQVTAAFHAEHSAAFYAGSEI